LRRVQFQVKTLLSQINYTEMQGHIKLILGFYQVCPIRVPVYLPFPLLCMVHDLALTLFCAATAP
jgi:hypothetical protein